MHSIEWQCASHTLRRIHCRQAWDTFTTPCITRDRIHKLQLVAVLYVDLSILNRAHAGFPNKQLCASLIPRRCVVVDHRHVRRSGGHDQLSVQLRNVTSALITAASSPCLKTERLVCMRTQLLAFTRIQLSLFRISGLFLPQYLRDCLPFLASCKEPLRTGTAELSGPIPPHSYA